MRGGDRGGALHYRQQRPLKAQAGAARSKRGRLGEATTPGHHPRLVRRPPKARGCPDSQFPSIRPRDCLRRLEAAPIQFTSSLHMHSTTTTQAGGFCVVLELRAEDMQTLFAAQPAMRESADAVRHAPPLDSPCALPRCVCPSLGAYTPPLPNVQWQVIADWLRATSADALRRSWLLSRMPVPTLELLGSRFSVSAVSEGARLLEEGVAGRSELLPSWRCHGWPPSAPQAAASIRRLGVAHVDLSSARDHALPRRA